MTVFSRRPITPKACQHADGSRFRSSAAERVQSLLLARAGLGTSRAWTVSSGGGTDIRHAEVNAGVPGGEAAHGFKFLRGGGHGGLDRGDLAEPALFLCLLGPVVQVGADLFQSRYLGWVDAEEGASDTGFSCAHGVPKSRPQVPRATFRSSKCARNSSHSVAARSRYSSPGRSARRRAMNARWWAITSSG
jgi:hypothetical protein